MKVVAALAAGVLALTAVSGAQAAVGVLDQANPGGGAGLNGLGDIHWQQEVTAGVDGQLTGITLYGQGSARVRIAEGEAFNAGPFAFSQVVALLSGPGGLFIDTRAANIFLSAGETFVIDLSEGTSGYSASSTSYAGGDLWIEGGGFPGPANYTGLTGISLAFETYMGAVPEPGAWALMILGFGLAGAGLRARRVPALA